MLQDARDFSRAFIFMIKTKRPKFSRILLKLSGEALGGENGSGIDPAAVQNMAEQICEVALIQSPVRSAIEVRLPAGQLPQAEGLRDSLMK